MQKLINSHKKKGVYHLVIEHPIRVQKSVFTSVNMCTIMKNDSYVGPRHKMYSICLNPDSNVSSGLYECSIKLEVSDPSWDVFPFLSFDTELCKNHTCADCHGELTFTVIKRVGSLEDQDNETTNDFAYLKNIIKVPESVKKFVNEFKKTFEIQ